MGYNGANNTGAEALLLSDIEDARAVLGPEAVITGPTLNEANLRRYLTESPTLRIAPVPTLFFARVRRLVRESDLVMLVEGSTYMDSWGSPLLWAFLWAAYCAAEMGKPCLSYAVDTGTLKPFNARLVRHVASRTSLIITRNRAAAARLRDMKVTAPMVSTADNALTFQPRPADAGWIAREWPRARQGLVGLAAVNFQLFPAIMRLWGRRERCYKWPYYLASSPEREAAGEALARYYAELADDIIEKSGKAVALICMEQLDELIAGKIYGCMRHPEAARIFSARKEDASRMTALLRSLDLLITSRFHAAVLSLAAAVPQIAIGHDTRLATLYADLGLKDEWFLTPEHTGELSARVDRLLASPALQQEKLRRGYAEHLSRARENRRLLANFVAAHVPGTVEAPAAKGELAWAT